MGLNELFQTEVGSYQSVGHILQLAVFAPNSILVPQKLNQAVAEVLLHLFCLAVFELKLGAQGVVIEVELV